METARAVRSATTLRPRAPDEIARLAVVSRPSCSGPITPTAGCPGLYGSLSGPQSGRQHSNDSPRSTSAWPSCGIDTRVERLWSRSRVQEGGTVLPRNRPRMGWSVRRQLPLPTPSLCRLQRAASEPPPPKSSRPTAANEAESVLGVQGTTWILLVNPPGEPESVIGLAVDWPPTDLPPPEEATSRCIMAGTRGFASGFELCSG